MSFILNLGLATIEFTVLNLIILNEHFCMKAISFAIDGASHSIVWNQRIAAEQQKQSAEPTGPLTCIFATTTIVL